MDIRLNKGLGTEMDRYIDIARQAGFDMRTPEAHIYMYQQRLIDVGKYKGRGEDMIRSMSNDVNVNREQGSSYSYVPADRIDKYIVGRSILFVADKPFDSIQGTLNAIDAENGEITISCRDRNGDVTYYIRDVDQKNSHLWLVATLQELQEIEYQRVQDRFGYEQ